MKEHEFCRHINLGLKGVRKTACHADDAETDWGKAIKMNEGIAEQPCILPQVDNGALATKVTDLGGDDGIKAFAGIGNAVHTGANGVCETAKIGNDRQVIEVGDGLATQVPLIGWGKDRDQDSELGTNNANLDGMLKYLTGNTVFQAWKYLYRVPGGGVDGDVLPKELIKGQGGYVTPPNFNWHRLVKYDGKFYDPSYGSGGFATTAAHASASFSGLAYKGQKLLSTSQATAYPAKEYTAVSDLTYFHAALHE